VLDQAGNVLHRFLHGPSIDQIFADESAVKRPAVDLTDDKAPSRDVIDNSGTVVNGLTTPPSASSPANPRRQNPFARIPAAIGMKTSACNTTAIAVRPGSGRLLSEDRWREGAGDINYERYVRQQSDQLHRSIWLFRIFDKTL